MSYTEAMKNSTSALGKQHSTAQQARPIASIEIRVQKRQARFKRIRNPQGPDMGVGEFFLLVEITAVQVAVYIPLSVASGKKPAGFVYQIEGTGEGAIATTDISCKGDKITQLLLGTIRYAKIPPGETATFRLLVDIKGKIGKEYTIVINRIHYKHDPSDARYQKFLEEINTPTLKFR